MNLNKSKLYNSTSPIGIFDSGLGGLSICKEVVELLPNESVIYLADSKNAPYGKKSKDDIIELSVKNTELLIEQGCKMVVVACNTATTNAISVLRAKYNVPFIGIEPAIKPAALNSKTNKIGILATKGTLNSELFMLTSKQYRDEVEFVEIVGEGLVPLIEAGRIEETEELLKIYLGEMVLKGVDKIVLGCSHYPFLIPVIQKIIPQDIQIIDSGEAVARQTKNVLLEYNLLNNSGNTRREFYTNAEVLILKKFLEKIKLSSNKVEFKLF